MRSDLQSRVGPSYPGGRPGAPQTPHAATSEEGGSAGIFGKLKNMFAGDENSKPSEPPTYGRRPSPPPPAYGGYPSPTDDVYSRERGGAPPQAYRPPTPSSGDGFYGQPSPLDGPSPPPLFGEAPPADLPPAYGYEDPFRPQQQGQNRGFASPPEYPPQPPHRDIYPPSPPVGGLYDRVPPQAYTQYVPEPVIVEPEVVIPPEPQVFVAEDSIVLILKPKDFYRSIYTVQKLYVNSYVMFEDKMCLHIYINLRYSIYTPCR